MQAPLVTSLGHAGLRIDAPGLRLLCDPWLSRRGAFLGSWFQFPDNSHLRNSTILDCDWVCVSHDHLDHMDLDLLGRLAKSVRVVIPRYPSTHMRDQLLKVGVRHVIELDAWQRLALNDTGDWVTVIPEQSPMCHDAAILLFVSGRAIMHTNDARLSVAQARRAVAETGRPMDLMAVQMSGASWHPICYEYPEEVVARIGAEKRQSKFKAVSRLIRAAQPRIAMPYAGPPCFLDPTLRGHNRWIPSPGIFPDQEQAAGFLRERIPAQQTESLLPGDVIDLGNGKIVRDRHWDDFCYADYEQYIEAYADRRGTELAAIWAENPDPAPGSGLSERFSEHFARLGELSDYFLQRIGMTVRFEVAGADGGLWDVHFGPQRVRVDTKARTESPQYRLSLEARWLDAVLSGRVAWEELFLSLRFSAWRHPDVYNDYLVGLLKHADASALQAVEHYETTRDPSDTVGVSDGDRRYEVSRYCPHAGEDLREGAVIKDGVLRCLGHNFEFDLSTGECLNARCDPLVVLQMAPEGAGIRS